MSRYNPYRLFVGSFIPNWLQCRKEISSHAKLVFARLAQYSGQNNDCRPAQETLANETGLEFSTLRRALKELIDFKLVEAERTGLQKPNRYHFLKHSWMSEQSNVSTGEQSDCSRVSKPDSSPVSNKENQGRESLKRKDNTMSLEVMESGGQQPGDNTAEALALIQAWNSSALPHWQKCQKPEAWENKIRERLKNKFWRENWKEALEKATQAKLFAAARGTWKPNIEWFLRKETVASLLEGKYDFVPSGSKAQGTQWQKTATEFGPMKEV